MREGIAEPASSRQRVARLLLALTTLGFLALIATAGAAVWLQLRNEENYRAVEAALHLEGRINEFATLNERVETGRRGYLLSRQPSFLQIFENAAAAIPSMVQDLGRLTAGNDVQHSRALEIARLVERQQRVQRETVRAARAGQAVAATSFESEPAVQLTRQIRSVTQQMRAEQRAILTQRTAEQRRVLNVFYVVLVGAGVLLVAVAGSTVTVMLRYMRALDASSAELRRLNDDLEDLVEERTADLQRANQEIQRFAYIVSHDLRSPLVNVMGFTAELDAARKTIGGFVEKVAAERPDLIDPDARLAVEEDLPEALGFIRTSTQKMDRLINAILRLSREGRRTLAPEPTNATALAQSVVDSLHQRALDAGAEIAVGDLPGITTDRLALEQILSNLIENAVKYLKPGRPGLIRVSGHRERDRVVYEVTDNGRGIDPKDHQRIFDLFRRSGAQDQPGEGIGLAHVRALAYRLGGVIDVKSELDHGATFRLSLPAVYREGEQSR